MALRLGCTVAELNERLSPDELMHWMAFNKISPIGDDRNEYMLAQIAAVNVSLQSKRGRKITEFIPQWYTSPDQMKGKKMKDAFLAAFRHKIKRG